MSERLLKYRRLVQYLWGIKLWTPLFFHYIRSWSCVNSKRLFMAEKYAPKCAKKIFLKYFTGKFLEFWPNSISHPGFEPGTSRTLSKTSTPRPRRLEVRWQKNFLIHSSCSQCAVAFFNENQKTQEVCWFFWVNTFYTNQNLSRKPSVNRAAKIL